MNIMKGLQFIQTDDYQENIKKIKNNKSFKPEKFS